MKAFKVWVPKFNDAYDKDSYSIIKGETASKVRYSKYLDIHDVYPDVKIMDIEVRRAPEFDNHEIAFSVFGIRSKVVGWKSTCRNCGAEEAMGGRV